MECWCTSKHKSWLSILIVVHSLMVWQTQGVCIEVERKALLEIKHSLNDSHFFNVDYHLPTWVDDGSTRGRISGECCDWERVKCNTTTGHVTHLSLSNIMGMEDNIQWGVYKSCKRIWPLNVSLFLHFEELTSLNLSFNCLDDWIVSKGLVKLSTLKKLQTLDLSNNYFTNVIFSSLGAFTSLKSLHLADNHLIGYFPALALENLEILDLSFNQMEGFERVSPFKKLKILHLRFNRFNGSLITSLSVLQSLKVLDLYGNWLFGSFPAKELSNLTNLETLDLGYMWFNVSPSIQGCQSLSRLKRLNSIALENTRFNKSIISCISALPSLKSLDLTSCRSFGNSFPAKELSHLPNLKVLLLSGNDFNGTLPIKALTSFHHLEVLDLTWNRFFGSIPSTIHKLSSLKSVLFAHN